MIAKINRKCIIEVVISSLKINSKLLKETT